MKTAKLFFLITVLLMPVITYAQWSGSNTVDGATYRNGFVGIGTPTPNANLEIKGSGSPGIIINDANGSGERPYIMFTGNDLACITGDDSNAEMFSFYSSFLESRSHDAILRVYGKSTTWGKYVELTHNGTNGVVSTDFGNLILSPNSNVGIGTSNPLDKLHVNGGYVGQGHLMLYAYEGEGVSGTSYIQARDRSETSNISMQFRTQMNGSYVEAMRIVHNGNVGIGTITPDAKLAVAGDIHSREVRVTINAGSDFVFHDNYDLRSLNEVEQFIKANKHLPDVAPAKEMEENGIALGEMDMRLLQKIEELTLYMIDFREEMDSVKEENQRLKERVAELEKE